MGWVMNRAKEPSTWAGVAAIATAIGQALNGQADLPTLAAAVIAGLAAVVKAEGKAEARR